MGKRKLLRADRTKKKKFCGNQYTKKATDVEFDFNSEEESSISENPPVENVDENELLPPTASTSKLENGNFQQLDAEDVPQTTGFRSWQEMGNAQSDQRSNWLTCVPKILKDFSLSRSNTSSNAYRMESGTEGDGVDNVSSEHSHILEDAIINNDVKRLQQVLKKIDSNLPLNEKRETALIVAVKLSHLEMVNVLLNAGCCDKDYLNIHNCSALDVALITVFDNCLEPRHSICWQIVSLLLDHNAEPACKDAMMYIVRTAFKYEHNIFIHKLISICVEHASSYKIHELLLQKLHRHQPMLSSSIDPFLKHVSNFSIKLIKLQNTTMLPHVISAFVYYIESFWDSKEIQAYVFRKLVVYATAAGWCWSPQELLHMARVSEKVAQLCRGIRCQPSSLCHLCRVSVRSTTPYTISKTLESLSLPESVKDYVMLKDVDHLFADDMDLSSLLF